MPARMAGRAARDSIMARNWDEWRWRRPGDGGELLAVRASRCRVESVALSPAVHASCGSNARDAARCSGRDRVLGTLHHAHQCKSAIEQEAPYHDSIRL